MKLLGEGILMQLSKTIPVAIVSCLLVSSVWADGLVTNTSGGGEPVALTANQKPNPENDQEAGEQRNLEDDSGLCGDPVSLYDGRESFARTDLFVNGLFPIEITRRYNSQSTYDSNLGYGWSLGHERRLYEFPDGSVVVRYGCGSRDRFVFTGGAYVTPDSGRQGDLLENPDGSFIYTRRYGTKEFYDAQGRLTAVQNKYGHRQEYTYDPAGKLPLTGTSPFSMDPAIPMTVAYTYRLASINERAADGTLTGNFVTFVYDSNTGRLNSVTSSDGRTVSYVHDVTAGLTQGNLVQVNGLEGIVSSYTYSDPNDTHNITSISNEMGETPYVNTYDTQDRVIQQVHGNDTMAFDYVVDLTETIITHTIKDAAGLNPYNIATTYYFDPDGNVAKTRDGDGNELEYLRDSQGSLTTKNFYENQGTLALPNLVLQKTVQFGYDVLGRNLSESVTLDSGETITSTKTYDNGWLASAQVTSDAAPTKIFRTEYTFNRDGNSVPINIASIKRRKDDGSFQTTGISYDAKNRKTTTTLPDGQKIISLYEGGSLYVTKQYFEIASAESPYGRVLYGYDAQGNQSQVIDANGNLTQLVYDNIGRITKTTNALNEETIFTYTGTRLTQIESGRTIADGEGQVSRMNYTAQGWLESVDEKIDATNWQLGVESYTYNSAGKPLTVSDALNRTTTFVYDIFGRLASTEDPLIKTTTFAYDFMGRKTSVTDANNNETQTSYDDLGRVTQVTQLGITPNPVTQFTYDAVGNLLTVTDAESNTTTYTYDLLSRVTAITQPLGQVVQKFYDERNRIDYIVNARGHKIDYSYGPWGVVSSERYYATTMSPTPDKTVSYSYDTALNLTSVTDDSIQSGPLYSYTYDELNRADVVTVSYLPGGNRILDYGYDRYGNQNSLIFTDGTALTHSYNYDKRNRLTNAVLPGAQAFAFTYYPSDELQQMSYPNGITTDYIYESNGPVQTITVAGTVGTIEQFNYTYDNVLNVDTQTDDNGLHDYGYDGLYQLTQAMHPAASGLTTENYAYDLVGNREYPTDTTLYDYDNNNRITQSPGLAYVFDNDGNMTGRSDGASLTYNKINRLTQFSKGEMTASYVYDPMGRRIGKIVNGTTSWYVWSGSVLLAEFNGVGSRNKRYAYMPSSYLAAQLEDANGTYYVHADNLQTPRFLTGGSQQLVWRSVFQAFGEAVVDENPDGDANVVVFDMRLPGQFSDEESKLHYNFFRYYDANSGRYVSSDPIGLSGGINVYAYAVNNPFRYFDVLGLFCADEPNNSEDSGQLLHWVSTVLSAIPDAVRAFFEGVGASASPSVSGAIGDVGVKSVEVSIEALNTTVISVENQDRNLQMYVDLLDMGYDIEFVLDTAAQQTYGFGRRREVLKQQILQEAQRQGISVK